MIRRRLLAVLLCLWSGPATADIVGEIAVVDGDTLESSHGRLRLHGVDAPELAQLCTRDGEAWACGCAAAAELRKLVGGKILECTWLPRNVPDELNGICFDGSLDVGAELVTRGLALPHPVTGSYYAQSHREARARGVGIFAGEFVEPWLWRAGRRLPVERRGEETTCP